MTITTGQMRSAGRELGLRREGKVKKEKNRAESTRPFGSATEKTLRRFAAGPTDGEAAMMRRELALREVGLAERQENQGRQTSRPFEAAKTSTLRAHVKRKKPKKG
ncbi:MAG: hypothetical protein RIB80_04675 [Rhodospirillales bacterium]